MVSRVPGYGHLVYLVLGFSCESHHVTLNNFVGLMMVFLIGIEMGFTILNVFNQLCS